jgi:hypothetical protein
MSGQTVLRAHQTHERRDRQKAPSIHVLAPFDFSIDFLNRRSPDGVTFRSKSVPIDGFWQAGRADTSCGLVRWLANASPSTQSMAITVIETHSPVVLDATRGNRTHYPVEATGGGLNSAISRRMSAKRFLGIAGARHLECDKAAAADDFGADLDHLLLEACKRPVVDRLGSRQRAQEIAKIVGERVKRKAHGVRRN